MFSNGDYKINARNVGEVIEELQRLPKEMPCIQGFSNSVDIVVFNRDKDDVQVAFEAGGEWAEERTN